jgi:type IV secretion system protein VirB2
VDEIRRNGESLVNKFLSFTDRFGADIIVFSLLVAAPDLSFAQTSPFMTGASALQTNILTWLTPVAIILVMVLGGMAMANRISWGWCMAAILGIAISFGAPQIVTWVRGMFGV